MNDNSYYAVLERLRIFANGHYLINTFTHGEVDGFDAIKDTEFPVMHPTPVAITPSFDEKMIAYDFDIIYADVVRHKETPTEYQKEVINDQARIAMDLYNELVNGLTLFGSDVSVGPGTTIEPFIDAYANTLTGVVLKIRIQVPYNFSACDIPASWADGSGEAPTFGSREYTIDIYDEEEFIVNAKSIDFRGSAVTVTREGNRAIVTISGSGGGGSVDSVNGQTGDVVLDADDINETATRGWLTSTLKAVYDAAVTWISTNGTNLINHLSNTSNPHNTTKSQVGLGNVDNTSDANKPVSTAQQTAIDAKENSIAAGTTSQYWRGDKSWQTLDKSAVGLGNVDNTSDVNKPISTATQTALNLKADATEVLRYINVVDSSAITGTTGATYIRSVLIPANTFAVGDVIRIRQRGRKTGTAGVTTMGIYVNTSDTLTGATLIGAYTTTAATHLWVQMKRDFFIKSATITEGMTNSATAPTDEISFLTAATNTNINWAVDQYIVFTVNPNNAGDTYRQSGYIIEKL